jgi:ABC transporter substrate binding protein (PQQ-dependent alcohol dehydrogenase system)
MDGLAQFLFKKNWTEVLILEGEQDADRVMSTAFQDSARKFGLEVVDVRPFVLSNDPRVRDETNIPLLTGDADYDVVFLADTLGEFGRYVPYHTYDPRPVVGSEGLVASAWHWTWERPRRAPAQPALRPHRRAPHDGYRLRRLGGSQIGGRGHGPH